MRVDTPCTVTCHTCGEVLLDRACCGCPLSHHVYVDGDQLSWGERGAWSHGDSGSGLVTCGNGLPKDRGIGRDKTQEAR